MDANSQIGSYLTKILQAKTLIKNAIVQKGGNLNDDTPFIDYYKQIQMISGDGNIYQCVGIEYQFVDVDSSLGLLNGRYYFSVENYYFISQSGFKIQYINSDGYDRGWYIVNDDNDTNYFYVNLSANVAIDELFEQKWSSLIDQGQTVSFYLGGKWVARKISMLDGEWVFNNDTNVFEFDGQFAVNIGGIYNKSLSYQVVFNKQKKQSGCVFRKIQFSIDDLNQGNSYTKFFSYSQLGIDRQTIVYLMDDSGVVDSSLIIVYWSENGLNINFSTYKIVNNNLNPSFTLSYLYINQKLSYTYYQYQMKFCPYGLENNVKVFSYSDLGINSPTIVQVVDSSGLIRDDVGVIVYWNNVGLNINFSVIADDLREQQVWQINYLIDNNIYINNLQERIKSLQAILNDNNIEY